MGAIWTSEWWKIQYSFTLNNLPCPLLILVNGTIGQQLSCHIHDHIIMQIMVLRRQSVATVCFRVQAQTRKGFRMIIAWTQVGKSPRYAHGRGHDPIVTDFENRTELNYNWGKGGGTVTSSSSSSSSVKGVAVPVECRWTVLFCCERKRYGTCLYILIFKLVSASKSKCLWTIFGQL